MSAPRLRPARFAAGLMNQQCWCWGCDVRRCEGNLLLAYGCERHRPEAGTAGSSCYTHGAGPTRVWLWGFGAAIGDGSGAWYVNRYDPRPLAVPLRWTDDLHRRHRAGDFDSLPRAREAAATAKLGRWIAAYEQWVLERAGASYRDTCVGTWSRRRTVDGPAMGPAWLLLADAATCPPWRRPESIRRLARLAR